MREHEFEDEDTAPLRPEVEQRIAIAKARAMVSRKPPNHPDRVKLEEFLRRRHWSNP